MYERLFWSVHGFNQDTWHQSNRLISNKELIDRAEQGEMQTNPDLYAEFMRRMDEQGNSYSNTSENVERWKADIALSAQKIHRLIF